MQRTARWGGGAAGCRRWPQPPTVPPPLWLLKERWQFFQGKIHLREAAMKQMEEPVTALAEESVETPAAPQELISLQSKNQELLAGLHAWMQVPVAERFQWPELASTMQEQPAPPAQSAMKDEMAKMETQYSLQEEEPDWDP